MKRVSGPPFRRARVPSAGKTAAADAGAAKETKPASIASTLKEQLALLSFIVLFAGIVSTDTYYTAFGVRYQILDLGLPHLIYRGVTAVLHDAWLVIAYAIAILWLAIGADTLSSRGPRAARLTPVGTYVVVVIVVAAAYFAAIGSGRSTATLDQAAATSGLPKIDAIETSKGLALPFQGFRLLMVSKDAVLIFKPLTDTNTTPHIHIFRREDIGEITVYR